jgi:hypothetical protein
MKKLLIFSSSVCIGIVSGSLPPHAYGSSPSEHADARLAERNALAWEVLRLRDAARLEDAARTADRLMALEREIFGELHEDYAGALEFVAGVDSARGNFEGARDKLRRVLAIREGALGKGHSLTTDTRFTLDRAERLTGLSTDQRRLYAQALRLQAEAGKLGARTYEVPEMIARRERAAAAMKEAVGPDHTEYALALEQLGWAYRTAAGGRKDGPYREKAAQAMRTVLAVRERTLAPNHPDVARALESLADFQAWTTGPISLQRSFAGLWPSARPRRARTTPTLPGP